MNLKKHLGLLLSLFTINSFATNIEEYTKLYDKLIKAQESSPTPTTDIQPGTGYSSDTQNIAPALCYVPAKVTKTSQSSEVRFNQSVNYNTIIDAFNIKNYINDSYGKFATDGVLEYLKTIETNEHNFSVNYYTKISDWVNTNYSYNSSTILNNNGNAIYSNSNNPMFRLICGDKLVGSYEEGAGLLVSLKINFNNKLSKDTFQAKIGNGVSGNIVDAIINTSKVSAQNNLQGEIQLTAYQVGGDPSQLSKILDAGIIKCNINNITTCQTSAYNILNYATNNFPRQIDSPSKLIPLGGMTLSADVSSAGLKLAPSYVTTEVQNARNYLITQYNKFTKYRDGFKYILTDYPVQLDFAFRSELTKAQSDSEANFNTLLYTKSPIDCWKFPNRCVNIKTDIQNSLPQIQLPQNYDLLAGIVVTKTGIKGMFWPNGAGFMPPGPDFQGVIHYKEYLPPEQRTGFYLIDSQNASLIISGPSRIHDPEDDGFSANGGFHDGGDCPYDAGYSIDKQVITFGPGGCSRGSRQTYITEGKPNPFYIKPID